MVFNADTVKERLLTIAHIVAGTVCLVNALYLGQQSLFLAILTSPELHATTKAVLTRLDLTPVPHDAVQTASTQLVETFADYIQKVAFFFLFHNNFVISGRFEAPRDGKDC